MTRTDVRPETFTYVRFERDELVSVLDRLRGPLGLDNETLVLDVDETSPFGRARVAALDPITLEVQSGALEDPKRPRQVSEPGAADILGILLLRARDLRDLSFDGPELGADLEQPYLVAWDVYSVGRLSRALAAAGDPIPRYRPQRQRRLYTFRTRHGFTDAADQAFDRLWSAERLTWPELVAVSSALLAPASA
jgi:hypothetical protein